MGKPLMNQFQKRFGDRISAVYAEHSGTLAEQKMRSEELAKAIAWVIGGILKRDATEEELLGLADISQSKKFKSRTPP